MDQYIYIYQYDQFHWGVMSNKNTVFLVIPAMQLPTSIDHLVMPLAVSVGRPYILLGHGSISPAVPSYIIAIIRTKKDVYLLKDP